MPIKIAAMVGAIALAVCPAARPEPGSPVGPAAAWRAAGLAAAEQARKPASSRTHARNVILFIGDGMGLSTITAARILEEQQKGQTGKENQLSFEAFPATALAKTYNTDLQVPESAGAMSAIMTGVKTRGTSVGMDEVPSRGQCREAAGHETQTLLEAAKDAGLEAGVVTTARVTLAVPAATYAHVSDRDWEVDTRMPRAAIAEGCRDVARQLMEFDHRGGLDVVLGGGRLAFMTPHQADPQAASRLGVRGDGRDLIGKWRSRYPSGRYVWSGAQLQAAANDPPGPLLGLFAPDDMAFESDRATEAPDEPSLAEMTRAAVARLAHSSRRYVLVVDVGGIDRAHHQGDALRALAETIALSEAVRTAMSVIGTDDTLVIVTADHSHTLTIAGYPARGNSILGLAVGTDGTPLLDKRGKPYATLSYANGPGVAAAVPLDAETHGGEDVPIYATGPGSQWIHGTMEQNVLYWIIRAALWPAPGP
ncbi:MAG: alkaline phosphatase [Caulobacteraceae bacterium]|nr:alkaline phosphatase [Caulobacteraceae bacterium]